jgi:hypothetical protein
MRATCLLAGLWILCVGSAHAQFFSQKKTVQTFTTPTDLVGKKLKNSNLTEQQAQDYFWNVRTETEPFDHAIRKNVVQSETSPFRSRRSVWASETIVRRSAEFGAGKYSRDAVQLPLPSDRWAASQLPEADYSGKAQDDAILAAVYRHFFEYRARGFAKKNTVYFLGLGPHATDAPASVLVGLQNDAVLKRDGVKLRPVSRSLEVTDDAIRDRDTGAYGPVFRVDEIGPAKNGEVPVVATFSERDGFWFTRQLTLRQGKTGWEVVSDTDYPVK